MGYLAKKNLYYEIKDSIEYLKVDLNSNECLKKIETIIIHGTDSEVESLIRKGLKAGDLINKFSSFIHFVIIYRSIHFIERNFDSTNITKYVYGIISHLMQWIDMHSRIFSQKSTIEKIDYLCKYYIRRKKNPFYLITLDTIEKEIVKSKNGFAGLNHVKKLFLEFREIYDLESQDAKKNNELIYLKDEITHSSISQKEIYQREMSQSEISQREIYQREISQREMELEQMIINERFYYQTYIESEIQRRVELEIEAEVQRRVSLLLESEVQRRLQIEEEKRIQAEHEKKIEQRKIDLEAKRRLEMDILRKEAYKRKIQRDLENRELENQEYLSKTPKSISSNYEIFSSSSEKTISTLSSEDFMKRFSKDP